MSPIKVADTLSAAVSTTPVEPDAWVSLAGLTDLKNVIERRVLLPMRERERAEKHGVAVPGSMLLFGPPGTGKTALARAVASRLGWAFIAVDLSTIALDPARLRQLFERLFRVEQAVIFFDEFEYLGLKRSVASTQAEPLTAELLRCLPVLRAGHQVLVICATNHVGVLDPALLRPGRFDLVLPIGPPDDRDRRALFELLLRRHRCGTIDIDRLAERSEGLTAADLESACLRAAQSAFEREIASGAESCVETADLVRAIEGSRPTVSVEELRAYQAEVDHFARF